MQAVAASIVDDALAPLRDILSEFMLVGGASIGLWIDQPAAPPARPTNDIDLVVMCRARPAYHAVCDRLRVRGFSEDSTSKILCRWRGPRGETIDVMPVDERILGFSNRWYADAFEEARIVALPSGAQLQVAAIPYLMATKFEAFDNEHRADGGDHLVSADMNDIIALIDGRRDLAADFVRVRPTVLAALAERFSQMTGHQLEEAILNYNPPDSAASQRSQRIRERAAWIAALQPENTSR